MGVERAMGRTEGWEGARQRVVGRVGEGRRVGKAFLRPLLQGSLETKGSFCYHKALLIQDSLETTGLAATTRHS